MARQLRRRERLRDRGCQARIVRRAGERAKLVDVLTLGPKGLPAGCQDVRLRRGCEDARCKVGRSVDEMLAGIEDQQDSLVSEIGDQARRRVTGLNRQAQHGGYGCRHQAWVAQRSEIDQVHSACERVDQVMPHGDGDRGLADPASSHDRDEARLSQLDRELEDIVAPTDHPGRSAGQVGMREGNGRLAMNIAASAQPRDRRHEGIASSWQGGDVAGAVLSIAQGLAQIGDVKPQAALLDRYVGPYPGEQLRLAHDLVGPGR